jgi:membrane peptidoglycan carboxypeptidase
LGRHRFHEVVYLMLRMLGWLFGFGVFCALAGLGGAGVYLAKLSGELPDYTVLKDYQPPVTTRVHAADGTLLAEYARQRRLFQPIETIPPMLIRRSCPPRTRTSTSTAASTCPPWCARCATT